MSSSYYRSWFGLYCQISGGPVGSSLAQGLSNYFALAVETPYLVHLGKSYIEILNENIEIYTQIADFININVGEGEEFIDLFTSFSRSFYDSCIQ